MNNKIKRSVLSLLGSGFVLVLVTHLLAYEILAGNLFIRTIHLVSMGTVLGGLFVTLLQLARSEEELRERLSRMEDQLDRVGVKSGN